MFSSFPSGIEHSIDHPDQNPPTAPFISTLHLFLQWTRRSLSRALLTAPAGMLLCKVGLLYDLAT
jgi:hypothetical protein